MLQGNVSAFPFPSVNPLITRFLLQPVARLLRVSTQNLALYEKLLELNGK